MRDRCLNPASKDYPNYGGRGITVCARWRKFENFIADMGEKPRQGLTIERIDNNGNYEPGNCRWATKKEQNRNKRNVVLLRFKGKEYTIGELSAIIGIPHQAIYYALKKSALNRSPIGI